MNQLSVALKTYQTYILPFKWTASIVCKTFNLHVLVGKSKQCTLNFLSAGETSDELCLISCLQFGWCCAGHIRLEWVRVDAEAREPWLVFARFWNGPARAYSGLAPVCTKLARDLSLKVSYSVPWTMARFLNETGFRAALNYATWSALARMPQCHTLALNQCRETDRDFQKPKSGQWLRLHLSLKES